MDVNKKYIKKIIAFALPLLLACVILVFSTLVTYADAPYKTYTVDGYGTITETQTAYLPYKTITKVGEETLVGPTDFTLLDDGYMYVLDSGNKRVVVADPDYNLVMKIGRASCRERV